MKINAFPWRCCIIALFLLALPVVVQAQFIYTTNNGSITITGYNGQGGAVVIPNTINGYTVISIGEEAFADSTNVTSIAVTNDVPFSIGADAFSGCTNLASVILTNNATSIGEAAFYGCTSLTNFVIPSSVTNIGVEAFAGCSSLTNISVGAGNPSFTSLNGILFDKEQDTLIEYPAGLTNATYTFPLDESVRTIGPYAFASCPHVTHMFITWPVGGIGDFSFYKCAGLTSVTVTNPSPQGTTNIGVAAFALCSSLTSVVIAGIATNIDGLAFAFCTNLTSAYFLGNAPPDLGTAFYGDPETFVYYAPGTTDWGATFGGAPTVEETPPWEFGYSTNCGSITIDGYLGPLFYSITPLTDTVVIPSVINGYPVTSIGKQAFDEPYAKGVTSVSIPNTVTSIGYAAFFGCSSLASVTIPNSVTNITEWAFQNCSSLTNIVIPDTVTSIEPQTFAQSGLTSIIIPRSITSVGSWSFYDCTSLGCVLLTSSVIKIGTQAFYGCTNLNSVTIPESVTNIGDDAFQYCNNVTSVYFQGNAPPDDGTVFNGDPTTIVYYLPGTTGWGTTFGGVPTELWNPQATAFTTAGNQFGFNITGPTNLAIVVEACTNLANPVWLPVSTNTLSASGMAFFSDPQRTIFPSRYYRFSAP